MYYLNHQIVTGSEKVKNTKKGKSALELLLSDLMDDSDISENTGLNILGVSLDETIDLIDWRLENYFIKKIIAFFSNNVYCIFQEQLDNVVVYKKNLELTKIELENCMTNVGSMRKQFISDLIIYLRSLQIE